MKDSLINLLVFLLVFLALAGLFLGAYWISLVLVPGGKGLVFANPYAGALLQALLGALVVALYRSVRRPGRFRVTWALLAGAFLLLLTLPLPLIQQMPPVRAADASPLVPGRFLPLEDGSQLYSTPPATVLIPSDKGPMTVSGLTQFDPLNQRFVFPDRDPRPLGSTGPERAYFQYTPSLVSFQTDLLAVYTVLKNNAVQAPLLFWLQAWSVTWFFLGLYLFFSFRTWPVVQIMVVLLAVRLGLMVLVYSYWSLPALVDLWVPAGAAGFVRTWAPVLFVNTAAACLFFLTWLSKPHRQEVLT